ncbi:lipoprotein [Streptomyces sp. NPDC057199]|uniref:lipoprotein n=1 Tax=Streptomyces sp. NPDC057199 TaxID=3346047 RepID=UPI00362BB166
MRRTLLTPLLALALTGCSFLGVTWLSKLPGMREKTDPRFLLTPVVVGSGWREQSRERCLTRFHMHFSSRP